MVKVITYGTYDMLHYGHIRLLERAKALGDYLIVGVTSDNFDMARGKINVRQSLMERIAAVRETGLADEIIVEEYQGQKIDDIRRFNVDIFTVGSDWMGHFDYLNDYCKVVYLERTEGVSSSMIRSKNRPLRLGIIGESVTVLNKFLGECKYVNGIEITGIFTHNTSDKFGVFSVLPCFTQNYDELLEHADALYIYSRPEEHYVHIKQALEKGIHVLCETPIAIRLEEVQELRKLAEQNNCVLVDALKTAYSTAYYRLILLVKSGIIGKICSVDATCTSLGNISDKNYLASSWNSITEWGTKAMLPVFQILGTDYVSKRIITSFADYELLYDSFTKIDFIYPGAVASVKASKGVKSEGELIVSGTGGYIYVPAPWWKTDYFEVRYENPENNRRFFYQLEGEGIRYEIVAFTKYIENRNAALYPMIENDISDAIVKVIGDFYSGKDRIILGTH